VDVQHCLAFDLDEQASGVFFEKKEEAGRPSARVRAPTSSI